MTNRSYIFEHNCKFCGYVWKGSKQFVKECVRCKRRVDFESAHVLQKSTYKNSVNFIANVLSRQGLDMDDAVNLAAERFKKCLIL